MWKLTSYESRPVEAWRNTAAILRGPPFAPVEIEHEQL
jgi:hypothetical protein